MTKLLIVGHGRMGRLVESLAADHGCEVAAVIDGPDGASAIARLTEPVDVAIEFTVAVAVHVRALAARGISVVIGTTGWQADEAEARSAAAAAGIGVLAASNFSIGLHVFRRAVETAAAGFAADPAVDGWIHEVHHRMKKDAPSGTALTLRATMEASGWDRAVDMSSARAGAIPGTHTVGFDGPSETVELTHRVRDRAVFARGALDAARWLAGRTGWYAIDDFLDGRGTATGLAEEKTR
jgi:4-hydroxy-tetrahydrodipicolinate reductase